MQNEAGGLATGGFPRWNGLVRFEGISAALRALVPLHCCPVNHISTPPPPKKKKKEEKQQKATAVASSGRKDRKERLQQRQKSNSG